VSQVCSQQGSHFRTSCPEVPSKTPIAGPKPSLNSLIVVSCRTRAPSELPGDPDKGNNLTDIGNLLKRGGTWPPFLLQGHQNKAADLSVEGRGVQTKLLFNT
jgi:hypothetical protein